MKKAYETPLLTKRVVLPVVTADNGSPPPTQM